MAESRFTALRVGLVIAAAIVIAAVAIFSIGKGARFITGAEFFEAHFHHTNGLQTGAPVSLSGVNIGAVESIKFPPDRAADYVVVKLWVEGSAAPRVRADSEALIKTMGLLGDKYLELTPGTPGAPSAEPGALLKSEDPIDYEALLRRPGAGDFVANMVAMTTSLRTILDNVEKGQGLLGQLIRGDEKNKLNFASISETLGRINGLATELEVTAKRLNHGKGLAAAMLSDRTNGRQVVADLSSSVASLRTTAQRLDRLTARLEKAQGTLPRLVEDRQYAEELLPELRQSTHDLEEILQKINSGQGTLGAVVNDPSLYHQAKGLLGGGGWGLSVLRGFYSLTHPFHAAEEPSQAPQAAAMSPPDQQSTTTNRGALPASDVPQGTASPGASAVP